MSLKKYRLFCQKIVMLPAVFVILSACKSETEETVSRAEYSALQQENEENKAAFRRLDSLVGMVVEAMSEVDIYRDDLSTSLYEDEQSLPPDSLVARLAAIDKAMSLSVDKVLELEAELRDKEGRFGGMRRMLRQFKEEIERKDVEIALQRSEIESLRGNLVFLEEENERNEEIISNQENDILQKQKRLMAQENRIRKQETVLQKARIDKYLEVGKLNFEKAEKISGLLNGKRKKRYYKQAIVNYEAALRLQDPKPYKKSEIEKLLKKAKAKL